MAFNGFHQEDFETFAIAGLDERMKAIQNRIQPKFQAIGTELIEHVQDKLDNDMFLHIAKHARRTVNPPRDTWLAIAANKRGYKKHPHFQVGLFDDHVFIWLACIYELPNKKEIATGFIDHMDDILQVVPGNFAVSLDHTKKDAQTLALINLQEALDRFYHVKKAEFLIGQHLPTNDKRIADGSAFMGVAKDTIDTLLPLYRIALNA